MYLINDCDVVPYCNENSYDLLRNFPAFVLLPTESPSLLSCELSMCVSVGHSFPAPADPSEDPQSLLCDKEVRYGGRALSMGDLPPYTDPPALRAC